MIESLPQTMEWQTATQSKPACLRLLDQCLLPHEASYVECVRSEEVCDAIARLAVRGAPAIGDAGAFALVLWVQNEHSQMRGGEASFMELFDKRADEVANVRPTAVNLSWAVARMSKLAHELHEADMAPHAIGKRLEEEATAILDEDIACCKRMGEVGCEEFGKLSKELGRPLRVETHCNAGSLATGRYGTALSVIYHAFEAGYVEKVWVDETRPVGQGARLTQWELMQAGVPATLVCDNMAGCLMQAGQVDVVVVGADRICANGDFANKIGTYPLAVLAKHHGVPFYAAAPLSTFDFTLEEGSQIVIEQRNPEEVRCAPVSGGQLLPVAPDGCDVFNPAFDVTPHGLLAGIITEEGMRRCN